MGKTVLILDDDVRLAQTLARECEDHAYQPSICHRIADIPKQKFDFALLDLRLVGEFGLDAIEVILKQSPACRIVILSGYGSVASAVEAVKRGAVDYLIKPASFTQIEDAFSGKPREGEEKLSPPSLSQVEHEYIDYVLTKNQGNITKTAKALGLHRQSLQRKLKKYT
jgi:two-component system response regulator RegA